MQHFMGGKDYIQEHMYIHIYTHAMTMVMDWKERKDLKFEWLGEGKEIWKEGFKREKGWKN